MSVKKNLTVATLAALLAVPAFGATNASHALHMPSVTAHADQSNDGGWAALNNAITVHGGHNVRRSDQVDPGNGTVYNGNSIQEYQGGAYVNGHRMSYEQALSYFNGNGTTNNGSESNTNSNNANGTNGATNSNSESNGSTQYTSKNSLPQTGENNNNAKAMAMGAVALGASASFMALSIANKNRQEANLDSVSSEPTVDNGDGKSNDDNIDDAYYHIIMANTFASIREDFKKF